MPDARVVGRGDWVTFPLDQTEQVQIQWWQNKTSQDAYYYVDRCWFGPPVSTTADKDFYKKGIDVSKGGETFIFIAAELMSERTQGAPHLKYHIRDLMHTVFEDKNYERPPERWAMLKIDTRFHYGQDNAKNMRWLVYHSGLAPREMYQHRFGHNTLVKIANLGITLSSDMEQDVVPSSWFTTGITKLVSFASSNVGHPLRPFDENGDEVASPGRTGALAAGTAAPTQINFKTFDQEIAEHEKRAHAIEQKHTKQETKEVSWWSSVFSREEPLTEEEHVAEKETKQAAQAALQKRIFGMNDLRQLKAQNK